MAAISPKPSGEPTPNTVARQVGLTRTEQFLARLAERSFLTLWSYPNLFKAPGQELCDLLVVFENHVIIFSDKEVEFGDSGNLETDWKRWYKRAIKKSGDQLFGAERWITQHPDRIFLDSRATQKFPFDLPPLHAMKVHRVVVAHDPTGRRGRLIGGSGSLHIVPTIQSRDHIRSFDDGGVAFAVGQIEPAKGFVHIFDDASLHLVMGELDTISDFVWYLEKKERFIASGRLGHAAGEEDLLAYYLKKTNSAGVHDFIVPENADVVVLNEGHFADRLGRREFLTKKRADEVSYLWDDIAARFSENALNGTLYTATNSDIKQQERLIRFLAREPRVRRRMLARALIEKIKNTPPDRMSSRVLLPSYPGDPHYIFVVVPRSFAGTDEEYRTGRAHVLRTYMAIAKHRFPDAEYIVGLAVEDRTQARRSEDLAMLSSELWTEEDDRQAAKDQAELGLLTKLKLEMGTEHEYPDQTGSSWTTRKIGRNAPCPCKSGRKFKKCCGGAV